MELSRRQTLLGAVATGALALMGTDVQAAQVLEGRAFGSTWRIMLADVADGAGFLQTVEDVLSDVDRAMSPYRVDSDLSRFNVTRTVDWQIVSGPTAHVAAGALRIAAQTRGAFDPTVGPLVGRYGFGPITGELGSYRDLNVRGDAIRKARPGLTLDLCGIAKGHALDRVVAALRDFGHRNALVEIGGEVRALGGRADGGPWQVALLDPTAGAPSVHRIIAPGELALATSGPSHNGLRTGRLSASHIIDPMRREMAGPALLSVSVLAETGTEADALATAFCAAGAEAGIEMAEEAGIAALFLLATDDAPREVMTGAFANYVIV
ncbi:FAD:protein FMN transferase [Pontivivens ytuae]|uniref:FAD:protein FMN transferase n=1 Tax=Pontivivens ytuae TaxID=2789856 RepID=A0A7S9LTF4_9RHOB|nr:FAD:protein FMN transferase [Pontivivens ytuae]QPH54959.1 FAD:protein FMN transferase [Pontivivens ytuae]